MGGNMTDRENPDMQQPGGLAAEAVQEARLAASAEAVAEAEAEAAEAAEAEAAEAGAVPGLRWARAAGEPFGEGRRWVRRLRVPPATPTAPRARQLRHEQ